MRWILSILIFLSLSSSGQVIRANAFYRPFAVGVSNLLLDDYPGAAAAYSTRKIRGAYSGSCMRVRRSVDNVEADVGFLPSGELDTVALKNHVGTGGTDDGFVAVWYDQSGNGLNGTQTTASQQPKIMDNGVILRMSGKPAINSDLTNNSLIVSTASGSGNGIDYTWAFTVFNITTLNTVNYIAFEAGTGNGLIAGGTFSSVTGFGLAGSLSFLVSTNETTSVNKIAIASQTELWINGASVASGPSAGDVSFMRILGGTSSNQHELRGFCSEMVFYNSNQSSNRTGIQSNINAYYSIY